MLKVVNVYDFLAVKIGRVLTRLVCVMAMLVAGAAGAEGVKVDFTASGGRMRALHGVNNCPIRVVHPNGWSSAPQGQAEFRRAGIPYCRLHDTGGAFGGARFVDIPNVFPNFDADETDPGNYDFAFTDGLLKPLVAAGTVPFYRLGVTIECDSGLKAYNIHPPKDYAKWARICEHVIRHYNEGWANGFRWNLRYWEIWNEPDGHGNMWKGTRRQFFELYRVAANHLKRTFPDIRIGGYGSVGFYSFDDPGNRVWGVKSGYDSGKYAEEFLDYVTAPATRAPLDFFSWHIYIRKGFGPERIAVWDAHLRDLLNARGLRDTESILDEWNLVADVNVDGHKGIDWDALKEIRGAVGVAAVLSVLQRSGVSLAMYYDAEPTRKYCGLFYYPSERTTPSYESFVAFNELYRLGGAVACGSGIPGVFVTAATDGTRQSFYVVNTSEAETRTFTPEVKGAKDAFDVRILDGAHPKLTPNGTWSVGTPLTLPPQTLLLLD